MMKYILINFFLSFCLINSGINLIEVQSENGNDASNSDCPKCSCGTRNIPYRIFGGEETDITQYPWMSLLTFNGMVVCGASIISDKYLLTAAHCVHSFEMFNSQLDVSALRIFIGAYHSNSDPDSGYFKLERMIIHERFKSETYNNDIALIKIVGQLKFDGRIIPVCLPERKCNFAGKNAIVIGRDNVQVSNTSTVTFYKLSVPIMSNTRCRNTSYSPKKITDNMLCAGYIEGGKDSCKGDSGGPLHILENRTYSLVGIVSWGEGCAVPGYPGVYTRVNRYISWIERNTKDSCFC